MANGKATSLNKLRKSILDISYTVTEAYASAPTGFSYFEARNGDSDNPTTNGSWSILFIKIIDDYGCMLAMQSNSNNIYFRRMFAGTMSSWVKVGGGNFKVTSQRYVARWAA